jgi:hypothetical protein
MRPDCDNLVSLLSVFFAGAVFGVLLAAWWLQRAPAEWLLP